MGGKGPTPGGNFGPPMQQGMGGPGARPGGAGGFKTKICTFWEQGKCTRGDACTFAHGQHELSKGGGKGFGGGGPGFGGGGGAKGGFGGKGFQPQNGGKGGPM